jgi:hypothetical protein
MTEDERLEGMGCVALMFIFFFISLIMMMVFFMLGGLL